jgi:hypothetical protein
MLLARYFDRRRRPHQMDVLVGISATSVHRIWRAFELQLRRADVFRVSPDPLLIDKIRDVAGLYLAPPTKAAVFAVDEKSQIQAYPGGSSDIRDNR